MIWCRGTSSDVMLRCCYSIMILLFFDYPVSARRFLFASYGSFFISVSGRTLIHLLAIPPPPRSPEKVSSSR